jgi:dual specificity tyrosine-phosphorylation-regulated kinase 2/3/4
VKLFKGCISEHEQHEVLSYLEVYFLGLRANKGTSGLFNHGFDDERGDYLAVVGDHINFRYELLGVLGRGSFGQVFKVYDYKLREEQALKVIRNKSRFHNQAAVEVKVLLMLRDERSPQVVQMREYFVFRKHLCITFELLSINLYDFLKMNRLQGLSSGLVKHFTVQMLQGLSTLGKLGVIHCDLKPENILLTAANKSSIKLIDVGSSCFLDLRLYSYIQSRFYRAPEVILGGSYTTAIDIWSLGCILCELTTGSPLFPGENEHDQLLCIMEVAGVPPVDIMHRAPPVRSFSTVTNDLGNSREVEGSLESPTLGLCRTSSQQVNPCS